MQPVVLNVCVEVTMTEKDSDKLSSERTCNETDSMSSSSQTNNSNKGAEIQLGPDDTLIKKVDLDNLVTERIRLKLQIQWYEEWCELLYDVRLKNDDGNCIKLWNSLCEQFDGDLADERKRLERTKNRYEEILDRLQTRDMVFHQVRGLHDSLTDQEPVSEDTCSPSAQDTINYLCIVSNSTEEMRKQKRDLQDELKKTQEVLERIALEKEGALTRLSELAGNRLTHNNSEIADLSDTNRPTNLAEKFNELYDNEWTDAFDHMTSTGKSPEDTVTELLKILKEIYNECTLCATSQRTNLYNALQMSNQGQDEISHFQSRQTIPDNNFIHLQKQITELQKYTSAYCVTQMKNKLATSLELFNSPVTSYHGRVFPFVMKCIELSWYMNIQEKPAVLLFDVEKGRSFRTYLYRHYTKSGVKCDYLVWPAMLLHDNGPLLQKGVIQPE